MGYQMEYGNFLPREVFAEEDIPYYVFVTRGATETGVVVAGVGDEILGVSYPLEESTYIDSNGQQLDRTGYKSGESPLIQNSGIGHVTCGESIDGDVYAVADANGYAVAETIVSGISSETDLRGGKMVESGTNTNLSRIDLDKR
jgi:hypothetical protein